MTIRSPLSQFPSSAKDLSNAMYRFSPAPSMLRDMDGKIRYWNKAAERIYGWKRQQAEGKTSHQLLHTIFPVPLEEINKALAEHGEWSGELIHRLSNGESVKVMSHWKLLEQGESREHVVIETNKGPKSLSPESAHLSLPYSRWRNFRGFFLRNFLWFLLPLIAVLLIFELLIEFTAGGI